MITLLLAYSLFQVLFVSLLARRIYTGEFFGWEICWRHLIAVVVLTLLPPFTFICIVVFLIETAAPTYYPRDIQ